MPAEPAGMASGHEQLLKAVAGAIAVLLLIPLLGNRLSASYTERSTAVEQKTAWAAEVETLTGQEAEQILLLVGNLAPYSRIARRCPDGLPRRIGQGEYRRALCRDATLRELVDEQQRILDVRAAHLKGEALQNTLEANLSGAESESSPATSYKTLLKGLGALRKLANNIFCGNRRNDFADYLSDNYWWMTENKNDALVGQARNRCDDAGKKFRSAAVFTTRKLKIEAANISSDLGDARLENLIDGQDEFIDSISGDGYLKLLAALAAFIYLLSWSLRARRERGASKAT